VIAEKDKENMIGHEKVLGGSVSDFGWGWGGGGGVCGGRGVGWRGGGCWGVVFSWAKIKLISGQIVTDRE